MLGAVVGLLVHSGAVMVGAKATKREDVNFMQCIVVALVSWVVMLGISLLVGWAFHIPLLGIGVRFGALWLATAFAAKIIMNLDWKPALSIGGVVALIQLALSLFFRW